MKKRYDEFTISARFAAEDPQVILWGAHLLCGHEFASGATSGYRNLNCPGLWDELQEMATISLEMFPRYVFQLRFAYGAGDYGLANYGGNSPHEVERDTGGSFTGKWYRVGDTAWATEEWPGL